MLFNFTDKKNQVYSRTLKDDLNSDEFEEMITDAETQSRRYQNILTKRALKKEQEKRERETLRKQYLKEKEETLSQGITTIYPAFEEWSKTKGKSRKTAEKQQKPTGKPKEPADKDLLMQFNVILKKLKEVKAAYAKEQREAGECAIRDINVLQNIYSRVWKNPDGTEDKAGKYKKLKEIQEFYGSYRAFARYYNYSYETVKKWAQGKPSIPDDKLNAVIYRMETERILTNLHPELKGFKGFGLDSIEAQEELEDPEWNPLQNNR